MTKIENMQSNADTKQHSRIRYTLIFAILVIVYTITLAIVAIPYARINIEDANLKNHIAIYKELLERDEKSKASIVLFGIDGPVEVEREIETQGRDSLHIALEAILLPLSDDELGKGLISYIPKKTKLIGVTESNGFVFAEFSNNLMFSSDLDKAIDQIESTIKANSRTQGISIISDGIIIN